MAVWTDGWAGHNTAPRRQNGQKDRYTQLLATKRKFSLMCWALNEKAVCRKADKRGERHLNSSIDGEHQEFPFMENMTAALFSSVTFTGFLFNANVKAVSILSH